LYCTVHFRVREPVGTIKRMGYRHSADEILEAAVELTLESGIAALTYSSVGRRLSISGRTVVYYFPSKLDLVTAVAGALVGDMVVLLEEAFGSEPLDPQDLMARAWPVLTTPAADRVFALYFEIVGLASSGTPPYDELAPGLVAGWVDWLEPRMLGRTTAVRRRTALATVGHIDGLLLVRRILGARAGDDAARAAGILT
jgi:AcrR family transcriptional regulator